VTGPFIFIGTEVAVVQVHPDADSMAFHMAVIAERAAAAYAETVEATSGLQVFGTPSKAVLEMLERQAGAGVPLAIKSRHLGGFTR
jgi:biotin carboxylase